MAQPRAVAVQLVDQLLHAVVGLGDRGGREGVGLDDVGAGHGVAVVDVLDRLRLGEDQQVVVALLVAGAAPKAIAAEVVLAEAEALDLRAHGAVEDQDALARRRLQCGEDVGSVQPRPKQFIDRRHTASRPDRPQINYFA